MAAGSSESPGYREALETLCRIYWFPLYAYLRRHGHDANEAEDYTQAFFTRMLEKDFLERVRPKPGKFRSFLLKALKHFIANERARAATQKRGGGRKFLSLGFENAERRYALEPADAVSPERVFERAWALTILERTTTRLEAELAARGKQKLFDNLKAYIPVQSSSVPYREVAAKLNMTEGAIKTTVHRLRKRCRELLRDEIAQTVTSEEQIDDEIRGLFSALSC
jgi:RNA polymerase sigma-70 factor (ECF subfamily)